MSHNSINRRKIYSQKMTQVAKQAQIEDITPQSNENKKRTMLFALIVAVVTFIVFIPTFRNNLTNWDDGKYTIENPLISPLNVETVKEMFYSKAKYKMFWMGNYHPLTMLTLSINYALADKDTDGNPSPFGFQLVNILLHLFNTLLVFMIIKLLFKNDYLAFFTALLFGVHTLHVESVSWVAERKDVLYTFFYLLAFYLYSKYAKDKKILFYILAFLSFGLSLLSKGQATSLAVTIILADYIYKRKLLSLRVIAEKIPFLILALIFGLIAIEAQKQGNALQVVNGNPLSQQIPVAFYGFTMYLLKLFMPLNLSAVYPYPDIIHHTVPAFFWLGGIVFAGFLFAIYKAYKAQNRNVVFGLMFFLINIVLLLQLIPVGSAMYADRYAYIPSIGFYFLLAYYIYKFFDKKKRAMFAVIGVYAVILSFLTIMRIGEWKDSRTLWEDVTSKQPKSAIAWNNLGSEYDRISNDYLDSGDIENFKLYKQKAIDCFGKAIKRKPDHKSAFYNRGFARFEYAKYFNDTSMMKLALNDMNFVITIDVSYVEGYSQRATIYDWLGNYDQALEDYSYAIKLSPNDSKLYVNRGTTKGKMNNLKGAIEDFNLAIKKAPDEPSSYSNRGLAYFYLKEYEKALEDYNYSISLKPEATTYYNRGILFYNQKEYKKALDDFNQAQNMNFKQPLLYFYKAVIEYQLKMKDEACVDIKIAADKGIQQAKNLMPQYCN